MKLRLLLVVMFTLALSAPAFAICGYCDDYLSECIPDEGPGGCRTVFTSPDTWECRVANATCFPSAAEEQGAGTLMLVSVETSHEALTVNAKPVETKTAFAEAR
ncbi:MAG TPA: hypothetical protein VGF48_21625 [Thermoanaerobaculia bacterium]|jgi:hypothetical protein